MSEIEERYFIQHKKQGSLISFNEHKKYVLISEPKGAAVFQKSKAIEFMKVAKLSFVNYKLLQILPEKSKQENTVIIDRSGNIRSTVFDSKEV